MRCVIDLINYYLSSCLSTKTAAAVAATSHRIRVKYVLMEEESCALGTPTFLSVTYCASRTGICPMPYLPHSLGYETVLDRRIGSSAAKL